MAGYYAHHYGTLGPNADCEAFDPPKLRGPRKPAPPRAPQPFRASRNIEIPGNAPKTLADMLCVGGVRLRRSANFGEVGLVIRRGGLLTAGTWPP